MSDTLEKLMALGLPWGLAEEIIEAIYSGGGGNANLFVSGVVANQVMGVLPANSWVLRLLLRDHNGVGANVGLGTTLGATNILSAQIVPSTGTFSVSVPLDAFSIGSFADGVQQPIYITTSGGGSSITAQLDYEIGP